MSEHGMSNEEFLDYAGTAWEGQGDPRDDEPESAYTDAEALDAVQYMLRDPQWALGMLEDIADIVRATGRTVEDYPDGRSTWGRH